MAKPEANYEEKYADPQHTYLYCPNCKARVFQGPYHRGEILDGEFVTTETVYQCMGCNRVLAQGDLATGYSRPNA